MFVVRANRVGPEGSKEYFGLSAIYNPDGEVVAQTDSLSGDSLAVAEIDLAEVAAARQRRPFLRDRRPDLYTSLSVRSDPT